VRPIPSAVANSVAPNMVAGPFLTTKNRVLWERDGLVSARALCHSQQPVPRDFPLFKRCEWLVSNWTVCYQNPLLGTYQDLLSSLLLLERVKTIAHKKT